MLTRRRSRSASTGARVPSPARPSRSGAGKSATAAADTTTAAASTTATATTSAATTSAVAPSRLSRKRRLSGHSAFDPYDSSAARASPSAAPAPAKRQRGALNGAAVVQEAQAT